MNIDDVQAKADTLNPNGCAWSRIDVVFLRYRSADEWQIMATASLEADFREACVETDALAAELTHRGATVYGVLFDRTTYERWQGVRKDTRDLRTKWAERRVNEGTGELFLFTLGNPPALEPMAAAAREIIGAYDEDMGWAVYVPEIASWVDSPISHAGLTPPQGTAKLQSWSAAWEELENPPAAGIAPIPTSSGSGSAVFFAKAIIRTEAGDLRSGQPA
jgi:hypothetical protein